MRLAVFGLGDLVKYDDGAYGSRYDNPFWRERYLSFADEIELCSRVKGSPSNSTAQLPPEIHVTECPDLATVSGQLHKNLAQKIVREVVERCDAAVCRLSHDVGRIGANYCREQGKPYLVESVGCPWDALWNHSWKGKLIALPTFLSTRATIKAAPAVVYVSEFLQRRYPTDGISIVCPDVSLQEMDGGVLERRLDKIKNNSDKLIIGTAAAVDVRYKGQQYVIEALGKLKKQGNTKFEYQLVGGGDPSFLLEQAKKYGVAEQVKLLGMLPLDAVFDWLDTIDLYAQPSIAEGFGRALVEAMSRGLPAFGARVGGIPELIESAFLFTHGGQRNAEIMDILMGFDRKTMLSGAERNFKKAKEYDAGTLHERRSSFYRNYFFG